MTCLVHLVLFVPKPPCDILGVEKGTSVPRKTPAFDMKNEVRKLARERVGAVRPSRPILPKPQRKKPKHPKQATGEEDAAD